MVIKPSDNPTCLLRNQLQTRETETGPGITGHETVGCDEQQERGRLIPFQQDGANWITRTSRICIVGIVLDDLRSAIGIFLQHVLASPNG